MKNLSAALLFSLLLLVSGQAYAIGPEGIWMGQQGLAKMKVAPCGSATICAKIVWLREPNDKNGKPLVDDNNGNVGLRKRPIIGLPVAYNMKQTHANKWQGRVYDPKRGGSTYSGYMTLLKDGRMQVTGCLGIFCQSEYWRPLK